VSPLKGIQSGNESGNELISTAKLIASTNKI
jgi:hypothetical protein